MVPTRQHHPDPATLERFVCGDLSPVERCWIERHLESCPECEWQADELGTEEEVLEGLLPPFDPGEYDQAFDRVLSNARGWLPDLFRAIDSSAVLFAELLGRSPKERWERILEEERFHTVKLCQLVMDHSREHWFTAPSAALDLAGLAVSIARSLDTSRYGVSLVEDVRARAWAYLGNAYRILADYAQAEAALDQARRHLELSGDPVVRGEVFGLMGSLANSQGRQEESLEHCDRALAVYREIGDQRSEARLLISKGVALDDSCRYEEAIRVLSQGVSKIRREDEPLLWLGIQHNLIRTMNHMRRHEDAWKTLKSTEQAYRETGGSPLQKGRWMGAMAASHLGKLDDADSLLLDVRESLAELGIASEVAHVSLDLAMVYARQGRSSECKATAAEVIPLFESLGLRDDAFAARLLYERAGGG
jgi:tetratricopeptide (TPR) repeat protein